MFWFLPPNNVICSGFCLKTNKKQPCLTLLSSPRITWSLPFTAPFIEMTRAAVSTSLSILHFLLLNSYCTLSLINSFVKSVFIVVTNNFQIPSPMEIFHHYSVAVNTVGHSLLRILFFFWYPWFKFKNSLLCLPFLTVHTLQRWYCPLLWL